jgi:hypothetical protein
MPEPGREPNRIVGAAAADPKYTRLIETLYKSKTPDPASWCEQCFELTLGEETIDGKLGYFVRETQCRWDAARKHTVRIQYTLSPRGGFATIEEAHEVYKQQRTTRAKCGYVHSYAPCFEATTRQRKYVRIQVAAEPKTETNDENG